MRGFALFGVLLVNMYGFGADSIAWYSTLDRSAFTVMHVFFESKSWTLFSLLFGFGFAIQLQRMDQSGVPVVPTFLRRLSILFFIGAAHALFYDGDILMLYAELGLVLLLLCRWPTRWLVILAIILLFVFPLAHYALPERDDDYMFATEQVADAQSRLERMQSTDVYATGTFTEIMAFNATAIPANPVEDLSWADSGLAAFAMFLFGFGIGRSGILRDIPGHAALIARVRNWGLGFGLLAMTAEQTLTAFAGYAVFRPPQSSPTVTLAGDLVYVLGTVALALGYAAAVILAVQSRRGRAVLSPLAGVGRMALTVYLTQTALFTTLFYAYGFGQAYRLGPAAVTAWALLFFALQAFFCRLWLRYFRFGPAEWLWRSLTYLEWQPFRQRN